MKNIYLFTATLTEAKPLLRLSENISENFINKVKIRTFEFNEFKIHVIITGIGPRKTKRTLDAVTDYINNGAIINIGIAGSLNNKLKIGEWRIINQLLLSIDFNKKIELITDDDFNAASILTSGSEITSEKIKQKHHKEYSADLVDMESFYIANFAKQKNLPCKIIKMISDHADKKTNSKSELKNALKIYNKEAANYFKKLIDRTNCK